ncbi:uncharacterized protein A4U43_C07F21980 [Asparagus officinalis]|uniref:Gamma-tubulin complex component n=1 Tax=Asparagus officinalis TaxID=4686 RepID=A0A5P1EJ41_ASPOF|nr:gamma-tubulin complex component 5-like [Asparagus officinalis]ONK64090.1 uncharacterized protein A4U43_C07F21980 [Asparagus officinalis]
MTNTVLHDVPVTDVSQSFISKLHFSISKGLPHAEPVHAFEKSERELVHGVLQMLQGFSTSLFNWDEYGQGFHLKSEIYTSHMSHTSLHGIVNQFAFGGSCLKKVENFIKMVEASRQRSPTLKAFGNSVKSWLKRLRDIALKEEVKLVGSDYGNSITLLGLTSTVSSLCSGAEQLFQVVHGAVPNVYFDSETSTSADEIAVHILDHLFKKLNEACLVQGGEEEAYHMLLAIFTESLLPYLEGLDSWLYEGILDDPYEEMFFYCNNTVSIDQPSFWETSYLLRQSKWRKSRCGRSLNPSGTEFTVQVKKDTSNQESTSVSGRHQSDIDILVCPIFLKDMARAIISAGKSLQLVQHVRDDYVALFYKDGNHELYDIAHHHSKEEVESSNISYTKFEGESTKPNYSNRESFSHPQEMNHAREMGVLTLSEVFLLSLVALLDDGDHIYEYLRKSSLELGQMFQAYTDEQKMLKGIGDNIQTSSVNNKTWFKFFNDLISERRNTNCSFSVEDSIVSSFCPRNPAIGVCKEFLQKGKAHWNELNISRNFHLPPLNDENLRKAIFGEPLTQGNIDTDIPDRLILPRYQGTDFTSGFQFDDVKYLRLKNDTKTLETLYPFPTLLPCFQENLPMSELLPFQKNSTLASRILNWMQSINLKDTPQPAVVIKECLATYAKKQIDRIGKHILLKLMSDWRLMDELGVLRAIYLLGSGDLLQQFLTVIYDKMDRGDSLGDDFELNTLLQESIRNSSDGTLLCTPDSLVVSITKLNASDSEENTTNNVTTPCKAWNHSFGIDAFDMLNFTYNVSWPLDLIANAEALKKYNQVMAFLLKVKRAKFVLDKARRWMWKGRNSGKHNYKHHLLVQQKLLHFVDAFHQYVMDRVYHSAWIDLCTGMASAGSLDEVIEVHDIYLLSIQRQCFVAPDKLWALIASRIKSILGLALDFYSIEQTLGSGGTTPAIKARCEIEMDRIEKQFDDCIAFLLRILSFKLNVGHFPHLADLVTRINYNYFYMSNSGNLQTIPRFEASAPRTGKTTVMKAE